MQGTSPSISEYLVFVFLTDLSIDILIRCSTNVLVLMQKYIFGWGDIYCKTALDNNQPLPLLQLSLISCNCKQDISVHIFCLKNLLVFLLDMFCNIFSRNVFFLIPVHTIALITFSVLWNNLEKYLFYMLRNGLNQVLNMILHSLGNFGDSLLLVFLCRAPIYSFCLDCFYKLMLYSSIFQVSRFTLKYPFDFPAFSFSSPKLT